MSPGRLRAMTAQDRSMILAWRNAPEVRVGMRQAGIIAAEEHAAFFDQVLQDPTKRFYVYEDVRQGPQGLVNFVALDHGLRRAEWGLYVAGAQGRGTGTAMALAALDHAFGELELSMVDAQVLGVNPESLRFHAKLGYRTKRLELDTYERAGQRYDVHHLELDPKTWSTVRNNLLTDALTEAQRRPLVIGSTRSWNHVLAARVAADTGRVVHWIDRREEMSVAFLDRIAPAYVFLPHWSFIVPSDVLDAYETVVFHMTDVPFGRGGSPLQNLVARGIYETKVTALRCARELDAGDVYAQAPLSLFGGAEEIYLRARDTIGRLIVDIAASHPEPTPQVGTATVFKRRTPAQSDIAKLESLEQVFDWIRMLDAHGYPNAFARVGHFRLEFSRAARYEGGVHADVRITQENDGNATDG
jgi:methionyl-tRNA formyltransferase